MLARLRFYLTDKGSQQVDGLRRITIVDCLFSHIKLGKQAMHHFFAVDEAFCRSMLDTHFQRVKGGLVDASITCLHSRDGGCAQSEPTHCQKCYQSDDDKAKFHGFVLLVRLFSHLFHSPPLTSVPSCVLWNAAVPQQKRP